MPHQSGGPPTILRAPFNRAFVAGLAGATIASLGLFALSRAGGDFGDGTGAKLDAAVNRVSGRQPIATTFRSDIDVIAFGLPPLQFDKPERFGDRK
jgi:hypothetical protein